MKNEFSFPVQWIDVVEGLIRAQSGDVEQIYRQCRIDPVLLQQAQGEISLSQFESLLRLAFNSLTVSEPRAIQILRHMPVTASGLIGMAALTAENLGQALDVGVHYFSLLMPAFELEREQVGQLTFVRMQRLHDFGSPYNELLAEVIAGAFCKMAFFAVPARQQGGQSLASSVYEVSDYGMQVHLTHQSSENPEMLQAFFGLPVQFGQSKNQFIIANQDLQAAMLTHNRMTHQGLIATLDSKLASGIRATVTQRVRLLLAQALLKRSLPNAAEIAAQTNLSLRTLSRRLSEEGTTLPMLIEETRIEYAETLLTTSYLPIARIAQQLGYSNTSAFSRAFKRARGHVPSHLRAS